MQSAGCTCRTRCAHTRASHRNWMASWQLVHRVCVCGLYTYKGPDRLDTLFSALVQQKAGHSGQRRVSRRKTEPPKQVSNALGESERNRGPRAPQMHNTRGARGVRCCNSCTMCVRQRVYYMTTGRSRQVGVQNKHSEFNCAASSAWYSS